MKLQSVIENIGAFTREAILVAHTDPEDSAALSVAWINPAFTELTGYTLQALEGKTLSVLACDDTDPVEHAYIIDRLSNWMHVEADLCIAKQSGEVFWSNLSFQPLANPEGAFCYWICIIRDISERKRTEENTNDLSLIAETTQDMVSVMDADRRCIWVNRSFERFTGHRLEDIKGQRMDFLKAQTVDVEAAAALSRKLDRREPTFAQLLCQKKDGTLYLGEFEFQPIIDELGVVKRFVSLHRDVTEKHSLELRYSSLINEAGMISYVKHRGRFVLVNSEMAAWYKRSPEWFNGRTELEIESLTGQSLFDFNEASVLASDAHYSGEAHLAGKDGDDKTYWVRAFRTFDPTLDSHLLCCIANDITPLKAVEHDLRKTQAEALAAESRLRGAIDAMSDGFVLYDCDDVIVMCNQAYRNLHGELGQHLQPGVSFVAGLEKGLDLGTWPLNGKTKTEWIADFQEERREKLGQEQLVEFSDGRWMLLKNIPLKNGEIVGLRVDLTDIKKSEKDLKSAQAKAELAQARLQAAIEALGDAFLIFDEEDRLVLMNSSSLNGDGVQNSMLKIGSTYEEILREAMRIGRIADAMGREEEWLSERMAQHRNPSRPTELQLSDGRQFNILERKTEHGDTVTMRIDVTKERKQQRELERIAEDLRHSNDLAEQRNRALEEAKTRIEHASLHDSLTGLANRRYLDEVLEERVTQSLKDAAPIAVLHIDLDRFKQINDTLGHAAGDTVLAHVANILISNTRKTDFAARVGGDEFVVVTGKWQSPLKLGAFADRLIASMNKPILIDGQQVRYGASVGIAIADPTLKEPRDLLINADMALYRAKNLGRNQWAHFSREFQAEILEKKKLADEISAGLERGEFIAHYQPQVEAKTHAVVGVEALVRWENPERGTLFPDQFLGVAAEISAIRSIDQAVLQCVIKDRAYWEAAGARPPRVSVNISGHRLREPELISDIRAANFPPGALTIELLESIFLDDADATVDWTIDQLREMGVGIELDDFGTGHSSIVGLIQLKPDGLKIDRQFVMPITQSSEQAALVAFIIEIGRSLGVQVVAEGVETLEHAAVLARLNCDILQGYAFARPMDREALIPFLEKTTALKVGQGAA